MTATIKILQPVGALDAQTAKQLREEIDVTVQSGVKQILLDMKNISFMDSSGLGTLAIILKALKSHGGTLYLCSINEQPKMLFELTGMNQVFQIFANQHDFEQLSMAKTYSAT